MTTGENPRPPARRHHHPHTESNSMDSHLLLEDFGQKVDLTRRIREVLLNYPEGTTVLKELIQNADDAGATTVKLCLDRRSHGSESLFSDTLAQWQGPALLAYNDAVFTEEDFVSISRIGGSTKHGQAWKTGRFGVGFNSVYHLTDLPSFVSGKHVVLFDPQSFYLPNISTANPGKRIDFVSSSAISLYKDQLLPYCAFGCDMKSLFSGTLFRFPLRNADQAAKSRLSRQAYTEDDICSLFTQLYDEGVFALLFLKSVLSIEMYIWDVGKPEPGKLYSCSISSFDDDTVSHRQLLLRLSKSCNSSGVMDSFKLDFSSQAVTGNCIQERVDTFHIVQTMASTTSRIASFATTASKDYDVHLLPWASVAACICNDMENDDLKLGRVFCFLPLPIRTGLSVQVNGYFEVSSNRRGIWYGEDMDRSGKVRSLWNRLLLEDVIAPAFAQLLLNVRDIVGPSKLYYSLWPSGDFDEPWSILVECIYRIVAQAPVLYTEIEGGKWVSPAEAFLHDEEFRCSDELGNVLVHLGMPIAHLENSLHDMLLKNTKEFQQKIVTPDTVRHFLRECGTGNLSSSHKLLLLEYCLEDLIDSDVGRHAYNLPLLPLANGEDGSLSEASKAISYFICNELEYMLLEQISDRVVNQSISRNIFSRLLAIAESSGANLTVFTIGHFIQMFDQFVPSAWRYNNKVVWKLDDGCYSHPTPSWFRLFWEYLRRECKNLSLFDAWPILPSTSGHLYRASRQSKLIDADNLSDRMRFILDKIGCKILDSNYGVEHPDLSQYVSDANGGAVLESIFHVISSSNNSLQIHIADLELEEKNELCLFLLDPKWYFGGVMVDHLIQKCRRLPIFRVYSAESPQSFHFSDLGEPQKYLPPLDVPSCFLGSEFVFTSSTLEDEILLKFYGLPRMGKAHFYRRMVLNRVSSLQPEDRDQIMLSVLQDLPQLCIEDSSFKEALRNIEFVPTRTGAVKCPAVLYDPRNEELHALLGDADLFPCGAFQQSDVLDALHSLGLRTSVSPETIIQCARHIEYLKQEDLQSACFRGKVLLAYLEVSAHRWVTVPSNDDKKTLNRMLSRAATAFRPRNVGSDLDKFWNDLRMICWCPVLVSAPYPALPWPTVSSAVAPPKLVRLKMDMWLVSGSMRILDGECSSTALSYHLGWSSSLSGSVIAAQLLELGKNNEFVTDQAFRQELVMVMPQIYARLTELTGSDEMDVVKAILEGSRWIWVGDGFATSDEVVLSGPLHLAPYIRVIPVDLAVFKELYLNLGVRELLNFADYANILCRMAAHKRADSLTAQELTAAILVVQHLAEAPYQEKQVKIYLPDASGRLLSASDLVYNDAPWLLGVEDSSSSSASSDNASILSLKSKQTAHKFVHGNISNDVAEKLGVCSLRRMLLAESADSMNLDLSGAAEAFGQHEALTTRLKHILEMYADGPGTLFELVQNAEDAGASKVIFLLDKTHYGTSSILSPDMADWQGPALYCYNDSVFSQQDLYAISRIGQESKLEKPFAIGRFGLGFNSAYHFTDVPSFVSGENIVMFDPHACNLPGISPSHPGLRIRFVGRKILEQFPDQFSPFLYFGCDLQHQFPGTLFRFPLRSASVACRSQIKKEGYAPQDVISLFSSFSKVVSETILFLRNVKSISIFVKDGSSSEMQLIHHVNRHSLMDPESQPHAANDMFNYIHGGQPINMDKDQLLKKLSKSIDKDLPWICQKVFVREETPSHNFLHRWIISECLGNGKVHNGSTTSSTRSRNCVPWAAVAAHLLSTEVKGESIDVSIVEESIASNSGPSKGLGNSLQHREDFEGRAFCFLPLPINTGLPVHVNAYFELSSNRRDIWLGNDMSGGGKKRSDWNKYLLEHVAAPAYARLLEKMAMEVGPSDLFFSFWPTRTVVEPWSSMLQKLYKHITDSGVRVLYTKAKGGRWISTKQALFPDYTFGKMHLLVDILSEAGFPLVTLSQPLVESFMEAQPALHYLTPHLLRTLLIQRKYGFSERSAVILMLEYCLFDLTQPVKPDCLYGLSLLPLADGSSTIFNRLGVSERVYIARGDESGLLKNSVPSQLVDMAIPEEIYGKLCDMAQSELSNISFLTSQLLERLLLRILPVDWHNAKQVTWLPGYDGQPSLDWMRLLWSYLRSSCEDLSVFSKWPILPVGDNYLLQLVKNSNVIEDEGWSENLSSLLLKVGCLFLRQDLAIAHPQLQNYVQSATAAGICNAFLALAGEVEHVEALFADALEGELHELRSFVLQSKWFLEAKMPDMQIQVLRNIPMFESFKSRKLVSLSKGIKCLKPGGVREDLLNDNFIRAESEKERIILKKYFNIQEASKAEFYKDYVLNQMPKFLPSKGAVSCILHDVKMLVKEDATLITALSTTPFVLASDGTWQQPCRLYDPRIPELRMLLHREVFFPSGNFSDPETLDMLVSLGLKQRLGYTGLLDCARTVSIFNDSGDPETVVQGKRLLACLDALASKLSAGDGLDDFEILKNSTFCKTYNAAEEGGSAICEFDWNNDLSLDSLIDDEGEQELWSELRTISWCPVYADPPLQGLPWLSSSDLVAVPSIVRPKSQMWIVSASMHILDAECCSTYVQCKLGWMDPLGADALAHQLIALTKSYNQVKLDSTVNLVFEAELQKGIALLYSAMQEKLNTDDFKTLKSALQGVPWIWIGDDFVSAQALAFDSPVKFHPYLYVVPSELSEFRNLLLALGVKLNLDASDYLNVLQRLQNDMKGSPLSNDQLSFVSCLLEAVADCYIDKPPVEISNAPILIPDSRGILFFAGDLVYNDAPWMENSISAGRNFIHPSISNDLAMRLGVLSLRYMSLVDEEMTKDLPCMDYGKIVELLGTYSCSDFLIYDLLELADCCGTKRLHFIFDKKEHPRQSLLQNNLGEYQGPALLVILEGASLSREEISSLQLLPPWRLRSDTLNYGLGLLSSYVVCDLLSVMSGGYYYVFDPQGLALAPPSSHSPAGRVFSLTGANLVQRFRDQFSPMLVGQNTTWVAVDSTIIRMPLSSRLMREGLHEGSKRIMQMYDRFMEHGSRVLLFLKSVLQVTLSTLEDANLHPLQDYAVSVDSSSSITRNPFSEKKWRKFQISRLFSSSAAATTKMHVIDINWFQGKSKVADRWLVVLSMGSGQTRNMALDRRYLAYNLTPVAGIAALISRNNHPADTYSSSPILSPLPLSANLCIPVTPVGCFLVRHNKGRYLFRVQEGNEVQPDAGNQLIEAWNRELMACVRDAYIEMILEIQKIRKGPLGTLDEPNVSHAIGSVLKSFHDHCYSLWPRSHCQPQVDETSDSLNLMSAQVPKADWQCVVDHVVRPFYVRVADLPVWQLYSGNLVKSEEGMFLAQPGMGVGDTILPVTVCHFVKEHYPVFSVPWDLIIEIQAVGVEVREIKPKMVRDLLRVCSTSIVMRSVETYVDVLEYCLSDILLPDSSHAREADILGEPGSVDFVFSRSSMSIASIRGLHGISTHGPASSGGDALEMVTSLGKALFDFGRGVVEDIGKSGGPLVQRNAFASTSSTNITRNGNQFFEIAAELRGLPCPTAAQNFARLGITDIWIGNREQQMLLKPLVGKFMHLTVLDRPLLANILSNSALQTLLKLQRFSLPLLAKNMSLLFHESWVSHVMNSNMAPWFSWENTTSSGGEGGPSPEWIRLFWSVFNGSSDDLFLFADWPLIPAFLGRPVLCRLRERHIVFIPPPVYTALNSTLSELSIDPASLSETVQPYLLAFRVAQSRYPWLFSLLNQCNIPLYDPAFLDCAAQCDCLPRDEKSLGQVIASKLVAAKHAGYFPELTSFLASDREELFNLFVSDFSSNSSNYRREELEVLRALPIYKTVVGSFMRIEGQDLCVISPSSFLKPFDEHCLSCAAGSGERLLLIALGVPELSDQQILVRFALPQFEGKTQSEQEDILIFIYMNWQDLNVDSSVVEALKDTKFVRNCDEFSSELSRPKDLFDPSDTLLMSVFSGERNRFPGERFSADGWLRILRKLGLQTASEIDTILECAKRVEFLGREHMKNSGDQDSFDSELTSSLYELPLEIWSLAESVVEAIFSNFASLYSNNFCNALGEIVCVPAQRGFPNMGGKRGGRRVLTSYREAILLKDWPLAWSCAPILSKPNIVPPEYSWGALHLRSPPAFSTVLRHLQIIGRDGGGETLAHWPAASNMKTVEDASCEVLKYLDKVWDSLSSSDIEVLQKVAFLPAANGTRLVKSNSLFVRLTVNLSPFAFELPTLYLPFLRILKDLGLRESLSIDSAKDLLLNLQRACGYQRLNPNELRAVIEILHFICDETDDAIKSGRSSRDMNAVVPDDGCRLVHASSCVYLDSYGSRFIEHIDSSRLRFIHPSIHERICLSLGIKKLSEVVVEELFDKDHVLPLESIGSVSLESIRQKLLSRPFQDAVYKIISGLGSSAPAFEKPPKEQIQFLLEDAASKLQFVSCIYTRFLYLPRSLDITYLSKDLTVPEWWDGSRHRALYYVDHAKTCILVAEPPSYISVLDLIAIVISDVLHSPTPLPLGSLFLCPDHSEAMVVDMLNLVYDKEGRETTGICTDLIGKEIMAQDALQVQIHPVRPFYMGEIVAWRSQNGEKLKYGRVPEDVRPSAGQSLYRLKVEIAPGVTEALLSSQVFSFRNVSEYSHPSSSAMPDDGHTAVENKTDTKIQAASLRGKDISAQLRKGKDLQLGRVSPAELVQAVQEMLSAAGISMDTGKQSLLKTTLTLQEKLKESREALVLEQDKADAAAKEADAAKAAWQCRVCLSVEVEIALVPCGHVLCRRCSSAVSRCPFCRIQVSKAMRIFRP
ncbi:hypothetical protein Dimus_010038 [Dionaea muscipula]